MSHRRTRSNLLFEEGTQLFCEPPYEAPKYSGSCNGLIQNLFVDNDRAVKHDILQRLHHMCLTHWYEIIQNKNSLLALTQSKESGSLAPESLPYLHLLLARAYYYADNVPAALLHIQHIPKGVFNLENAYYSPFVQALLQGIADSYVNAPIISSLPPLSNLTSSANPNVIDRGNISKSYSNTMGRRQKIFQDILSSIDSQVSDQFDDLIVSSISSCHFNLLHNKHPEINNMAFDESNAESVYCQNRERQAIGFALECRRIDLLDCILQLSKDKAGILKYLLLIITRFYDPKDVFVHQVNILAMQHVNLSTEICDYQILVNAFVSTNNYKMLAELMIKLAERASLVEDSELIHICYQLLFDMLNCAPVWFMNQLSLAVKNSTAYTSTSVKRQNEPGFVPLIGARKRFADYLRAIYSISRGSVTSKLHYDFLVRCFNFDVNILRAARNQIKTSTALLAVAICNGILHCGTTADGYYREISEWLSKLNNWAKFTVIVSFGMIHRSNERDITRILSLFLPKSTGGSEIGPATASSLLNSVSSGVVSVAYEEGGALYALGLVFQNLSTKYRRSIIRHMRAAKADVFYHGAALGTALMHMGTGDPDLLTRFEQCLKDSSLSVIRREAAGYAYGLVCLGILDENKYSSNSSFCSTAFGPKKDIVNDFVKLLMSDPHEKVKRSIMSALALIFIQKRGCALKFIETHNMLADNKACNADCRAAAAYIIGTAFVGTADNQAVKILWNLAIDDHNTNVRRAAIISLGFVLLKDLPQCYDVMAQLFRSHRSIVRATTAFALGFVFAGTGSSDVYMLIKQLHGDMDSRVRQAAFLATAMIFIQVTEKQNVLMRDARDSILHGVQSKNSESLTKFGAIIASGLIDACGRNATIALVNVDGSINESAVAGMFMYGMSYYWYPLINMISLCLIPTCCICIKANFTMPRIDIYSTRHPKMFGYSRFVVRTKPHRKTRKNILTSSKHLSIHHQHHKRGVIGAGRRADNALSGMLKQISEQINTEKSKSGESGSAQSAVSNNQSTLESEKKKNSYTAVPMSVNVIPAYTIIRIRQKTDEEKLHEVAISGEMAEAVTESTGDSTEGDSKRTFQQKLLGVNMADNTAVVEMVKDYNLKTNDDEDEEEEELEDEESSSKKHKEKQWTLSVNPARALPKQLKYLRFKTDFEYKFYKPLSSGGIFVVKQIQKPDPDLYIQPLHLNKNRPSSHTTYTNDSNSGSSLPRDTAAYAGIRLLQQDGGSKKSSDAEKKKD